MRKIVATAILGTFLSLAFYCNADPLDCWLWRYPLPPGDNLSAITYGNGQFVAVGGHGMIATSINGTNWVHRPTRADIQFESVAYGNGIYVAVGLDIINANANGAIFVSTNAINWSQAIDPETIWWLRGVAYGNGKFVAVGITGGIYVSTDGTHWIPSNDSSDCCSDLEGVCFGNGQFVIAQAGGSMIVSADGTHWMEYYTGTPYGFWDIQFGNGIYVANGSYGIIATSTNGVDWTNLISSYSGVCIGFANGNFIGDDGSTSQDGINWTPPNTLDGSLVGVVWANGTYVAVGSPDASVFTSSNGTDWNSVNSEPFGTLAKIIYSQNHFIAVGADGLILTSSSGVAYEHQNSGTANNLNTVAGGDGCIIAAGDDATVLFSPDTINWMKITNVPTIENLDILGMTHGDHLFIAVGNNGAILTSQNGTNWTQQNSGVSTSLRAITHGCNGRFLIAGDNGTILTSLEGTNWALIPLATDDKLCDIAYGNGRYVVLGNNFGSFGTDVFVSRDGTNWTTAYKFGAWLYSVSFGDGQFVAVGAGFDDSVEITPIYTSPDGTNWNSRFPGTTGDLFSVAYGNSMFEAAGDFILESQPIVKLRSPGWQPDRTFRIEITGPSGSTNQIQISTNLLDWENLTNVILTGPLGQFSDPSAGNSERRFYRAISPF